MEMQIHIDSKCKFALDDITLWANRCTKCQRKLPFHVFIW